MHVFGASIALFLCFFISETHAQFPGALPQAVVSLTSNPQYPGPFTETTVSLDDYSVNAVGAVITWYIDGKEQVESKNVRSITLTTGSVGKSTVVKVTLTRQNGGVLTASKTLTPTAVDILVEADTYTPTFYIGKALPSAEANVRAVALVHDGSSATPDSYTYLWSLDTNVLRGGAVRGAYTYDFTMPRYKNKILSVQVLNTRGEVVGKGSTILNPVDPELYFYEHSPLRGLSTKTLTAPYPLIGEETTIYGEPYFLHTGLDTNETTFDWRINGTKVNSDFGTPNAVSLKRVGENGEARVDASITTKKPIPQALSKGFDLFFNSL